MSENFATVDEPLPEEQVLHVNDICDRFEVAWQASATGAAGPRVEDFLDGTAGAERSALLRHLVLLDIDYRRLRGEGPSAADYASRFPELSARFLAEDAVAAQPAPAPADEGDPVETTIYTPAFQPQLRSLRYVVRKFHARGGIGEVWLARDAEIGRQVALKRLRKKRQDQKERFLAEAQITGQLEHPGIVPVHDLGIDEDGQAFYVMSFIQGQPLRQAIEEHHAAESVPGEARDVQRARLLEVFVKVCHAVAYAHHRGVIHRDLKPENVMLGPFGEALVLDWGMAKVRNQPERPPGAEPVQASYSSGSGETRDGTIMGSPAYMAPEMAEGHAAEADERTDVYLLGATLYHILTGRAPRHAPSQSEAVELARTTPPPLPRQFKPDVPRALEAICLKAMAHRPQDRYAGALALAEDMERYLAGAPVHAYPEPLAMRAWRWCKRHRRALGRSAIAALVLAVILVGAGLVHDARQKAEATRIKAEEVVRAAKEKEDEAQRRAELANRRDQARLDLAAFHRLAEERHFHAQDVTTAGVALYFDPDRGRRAGEKAIELADQLGPELDELQLALEREALDRELRELLLHTVQAQTRQPPQRDAVPKILERLERAASLKAPSRSYHWLRARCYRAVGEDARADEEEQQAQAAPSTALDHFLQAEDYRSRAADLAERSDDALAWRPDPELLRKAVAEYQSALRDEPSNFWCYMQLGRCYLGLSKGEEALEALGTCVALKPDSPWGYSARGLARGLVGHYEDGEADLERALTIDKDFRPARLHRGLLAWLQGEKDERALADFAAVLEPGDGRLIDAAYYRALLRLGRKEYQEALTDFDTVVKENPHFRPVYLTRAEAYFLHGATPEGLADLTKFLNLGRPVPFDPKGPALFAARGRLLLQLVPKWQPPVEEYRTLLRLARTELESAREKGQRTAELFDDLGSVAELLGEFDKALAAYEQALKLKGSDELRAKVFTKRGLIWVQEVKPPELDRARDDYREALRLVPGRAAAHAGLGYVEALQNAPDEATRAANQALLYEADNYTILHNVACIYAELSRVEKGREKQHQDKAMDLLRRAVELCRPGKERDFEIEIMKTGEPSFEVLKGRTDWKKLVGEDGP